MFSGGKRVLQDPISGNHRLAFKCLQRGEGMRNIGCRQLFQCRDVSEGMERGLHMGEGEDGDAESLGRVYEKACFAHG